MKRGMILLFACAIAIVVVALSSGCVGLSGGGGGGGYYAPTTYTLVIRNDRMIRMGWALTPPGSTTWIQSGNLDPGRVKPLYGLSGSYDVDAFYGGTDGTYVGSVRVNGGGVVTLDAKSGIPHNPYVKMAPTKEFTVESDEVTITFEQP